MPRTTPPPPPDANGNALVVWESFGADGSGNGVYGRRFGPTGAAVGGEFRINTYTMFGQDDPAVAADGAGNFVVVWESAGQDGTTISIFGQRLDGAGLPIGTEFQVNAPSNGNQFKPAVAAGAAGFVVVWHEADRDGSGTAVVGQRFDSTGAKAGTELILNGYTTSNQDTADVTMADDGELRRRMGKPGAGR